jgi:membrane associated rhomboid family serine protease
MTPWVTRLLVANIAMFALSYTVLPGYIAELMVFVPRAVLTRPWTLVTYMFLHGGLTHLLFNMLGLFFFGGRVEARLGERRFITLYFLSGIAGALASLVFTPRAAVIGASAGVFGVMMAFAMFWPREKIYIWGIIPVEARILVIVTTAMALYAGFGGRGGGVAHFAHLGGYVGAWLYLWFLQRNTAQRRFKARVDAVAPEVKRAVSLHRDQLNLEGVHALTREEVDRILDKINAQGMSSLTPEELRFLSNFAPMDDRKPLPPS